MKRDRDDDARRAGQPPPLSEAEDMMACAVCGVYRPVEFLDPCERDDCRFLKSGWHQDGFKPTPLVTIA